MPAFSPPPGTATSEQALAHLARRVEAILRNPQAPPYVRVDQEVPAASPLAWLAAQQGQPRLYWHARGEDERVAALGETVSVSGATASLRPLALLLDRLGPEARFYGGLRFDASRPPDGSWTLNDAYRFTLPRFTFTQHHAGTATLSCHLCPSADRARRDEILAALCALAPPSPLARLTLPLPLSREDLPDAQGWSRHLAHALAAFRTGMLDKVVLARRVTFRFPSPLDAFALLHRLEEATPNCFHFLTEHTPHAAFVGASPERLFRLHEGRLESEAIAGTRPRSLIARHDAALRDELLGSDKDRREHGYVRAYLRERLEQLTIQLHLDAEPQEMTLARGRHLRSYISGTLHPRNSPLDVLAALHPTPAVGGTPTEPALAFVRQAEPFDRGRYAAPIGWVSQNAAEFAVGIRAGRVEGETLSLYSGAGIVEGSEAQSEWDEIEGKIADFVAVLGLDARKDLR